MDIDINEVDFSNLKEYPNIGYSKEGELTELSFDGNTLLRRHNTILPMSPEAQAEYDRCSKDMFYFIETYCKIHTQDHGKIIPILRDYQKNFINMLHNENRIIAMMARQIGKTSSCALYIVWNICFQTDWVALIVANEDDLKKEIVEMIQSIYENLPPFLQSSVKKWNMGTIELSNGCKVKSAVAGKNAGRGKTPNLVMLDEAAWIDEVKMKAFMDSVKPSLSSGTNNKFVIISTPHGFNTFHKYWKDAIEKASTFKHFFANWKAVKGRDEKWKENKIKEDNLTPLEWAQNYNCTFNGSEKVLLSVETLSTLSKMNPIIDDYIVPDGKLYKEYNEDARYLLTVDSSKTVGKEDADNDYICLHVLELTETNIEQVFTFRTNDIHYREMSKIIYDVGEAFGFPWAIVENNEGAGQSIVDSLEKDFEYPNIYADPKHEGQILGIRTTTSRRQISLNTLKKLIEQLIFIINHDITIDEFFTFVKVGKKYQASANNTDDCIMSLLLSIYFLLDENNELEITINDYIKNEVKIENSNSDELDFFSGTLTPEETDVLWLLEGRDF